MAKRRAAIDDPIAAPEEPFVDGLNRTAETLEQRVHRLEDAVAALQDTHIMEDRISERVLDRVGRLPSPEAPAPENAARPPAGAADAAGFASPDGAAETAAPPAAASRTWAVVEGVRDIRTMFRMFFDHRYRASWSAYFSLMILAYILVSQWLWMLWAAIPVIGLLAGPLSLTFFGSILDKALDLVLALFAFKVLNREMRRYRELSAAYPPYRP